MHEVTLTFLTNEEVTPHLFAEKIAWACARGGALRIGERVESEGYLYEYTEDRRTSNFLLGVGNSRKMFAMPVVEEIHMSAQVDDGT